MHILDVWLKWFIKLTWNEIRLVDFFGESFFWLITRHGTKQYKNDPKCHTNFLLNSNWVGTMVPVYTYRIFGVIPTFYKLRPFTPVTTKQPAFVDKSQQNMKSLLLGSVTGWHFTPNIVWGVDATITLKPFTAIFVLNLCLFNHLPMSIWPHCRNILHFIYSL